MLLLAFSLFLFRFKPDRLILLFMYVCSGDGYYSFLPLIQVISMLWNKVKGMVWCDVVRPSLLIWWFSFCCTLKPFSGASLSTEVSLSESYPYCRYFFFPSFDFRLLVFTIIVTYATHTFQFYFVFEIVCKKYMHTFI